MVAHAGKPWRDDRGFDGAASTARVCAPARATRAGAPHDRRALHWPRADPDEPDRGTRRRGSRAMDARAGPAMVRRVARMARRRRVLGRTTVRRADRARRANFADKLAAWRAARAIR